MVHCGQRLSPGRVAHCQIDHLFDLQIAEDAVMGRQIPSAEQAEKQEQIACPYRVIAQMCLRCAALAQIGARMVCKHRIIVACVAA